MIDRVEVVSWYLRNLSTHPWIHDQHKKLYLILADTVEVRSHLADPEEDAVSFFEKAPDLVPMIDKIVDLLEAEARRAWND